jgi:hypothetical protein
MAGLLGVGKHKRAHRQRLDVSQAGDNAAGRTEKILDVLADMGSIGSLVL